MKVFIIFLGLLIANVTFITYQGDLSRYLRIQEFLKATAEECACGAAQYYDEEAFSRGVMAVDPVEAEKYAQYITAKAEDILLPETGGSLEYEMKILPGSTEGAGAGEPAGSPAVVVKLTLTTTDLFRLSFLKAEQVTRAAKYELVGTGGE